MRWSPGHLNQEKHDVGSEYPCYRHWAVSHWEPKSWNTKWEESLQFTLTLSLKSSVVKQYFSVLTNLIMAKRGSVLLFAIKKSEFISPNLKRDALTHINKQKNNPLFTCCFVLAPSNYCSSPNLLDAKAWSVLVDLILQCDMCPAVWRVPLQTWREASG